MKTFRGLNRTIRVPFPKPKTRPHDATTFPGSAPDNGKIREAYAAPNSGNNNYAQTLPVAAGTKKTNMNKKLSRSTLALGAQYESDVIMSLNDLDSIFEAFINEKLCQQVDDIVYEELKVGEKGDVDGNNEAKKVRGTNAKGPGTGKVKRKYLGKSRGTTATGKPAHVIITEPVIGEKDKNWNKTTPSGNRKANNVKEEFELNVGTNLPYHMDHIFHSSDPKTPLDKIGSFGGPIFRFNPIGPPLYTPGLPIYQGIAFGELEKTVFETSKPEKTYNEPMIDPRVYSYPIRTGRK